MSRSPRSPLAAMKVLAVLLVVLLLCLCSAPAVVDAVPSGCYCNGCVENPQSGGQCDYAHFYAGTCPSTTTCASQCSVACEQKFGNNAVACCSLGLGSCYCPDAQQSGAR